MNDADFRGAILDPEMRGQVSRRGAQTTAERSGGIPFPALLQNHKLWLDSGSRQGARADISDRDLSDADLRGLDLTAIVAARCRLMGAQLHRTTLAMADLRFADLRNAQLSYADLRGANLTRAYLSGADLRGANLAPLVSAHRPDRQWPTTLESAKLIGTDLRGTHLQKAKLTRADLSQAKLEGADLTGANLEGCVMPRTAFTQQASLVGLANASLTSDPVP